MRRFDEETRRDLNRLPPTKEEKARKASVLRLALFAAAVDARNAQLDMDDRAAAFNDLPHEPELSFPMADVDSSSRLAAQEDLRSRLETFFANTNTAITDGILDDYQR